MDGSCREDVRAAKETLDTFRETIEAVVGSVSHLSPKDVTLESQEVARCLLKIATR